MGLSRWGLSWCRLMSLAHLSAYEHPREPCRVTVVCSSMPRKVDPPPLSLQCNVTRRSSPEPRGPHL